MYQAPSWGSEESRTIDNSVIAPAFKRLVLAGEVHVVNNERKSTPNQTSALGTSPKEGVQRIDLEEFGHGGGGGGGTLKHGEERLGFGVRRAEFKS